MFEVTISAGTSKRKPDLPIELSRRPAYVTNITDADELKAVLKEHIDAVLGRYGSDLYAFDVINERERLARTD